MDLFIGIVVGGVLAGIISLVIRAVKKSRPSDQTPEAKDAAYYALRDKLSLVTSLEGYRELLEEFNSQQDKLHKKHHSRLVVEANRCIQQLEDKEKEREATKPKLQKLRALYDTADKDELFVQLHRINLGVDGVITYDQLDMYGERGELERFSQTYDQLLEIQLRKLLVAARYGTVDDYQKVMNLWEELNDFSSDDGEDRKGFVTEHLASEWNEMIVRFKRNLDSYEDVFGLDQLSEDGYGEIIRKARKENDFLSLRLSILFADEDPYGFGEVMFATIMDELQTELDEQYLLAGFKPGEDERGVQALAQ